MTLDEIKDRRLRERIQRQIEADDAHQSVGGLADPKPEPHPIRTLEQKPEANTGRKRGVPTFVVSITSYRLRKLDSDNLIAGAKAIRDSVAARLGLDDADDRITWEYAQVVTKGKAGTHITITGT